MGLFAVAPEVPPQPQPAPAAPTDDSRSGPNDAAPSTSSAAVHHAPGGDIPTAPEGGPSSAPAVSATSSPAPRTDASAAWPPELTRRLRVFLHTLPLDGLRRSDSLRDPQLRHYDGLALALRALDTVIDRMGLENEATSEAVARQLDPILSAMDEAVGVDSSRRLHDLMVERLLSGLRNDGDARRPFREEYTAVDADGTASRRFVEFRLLHDSHHPDGSIVLRVTNEAAGRPAGVSLVNNLQGRGDLVYLGVAPEFRQRGVGRALVVRAVRGTAAMGLSALGLAVDVANTAAMRLYEKTGFKEVRRRLAYFVPREGLEALAVDAGALPRPTCL